MRPVVNADRRRFSTIELPTAEHLAGFVNLAGGVFVRALSEIMQIKRQAQKDTQLFEAHIEPAQNDFLSRE